MDSLLRSQRLEAVARLSGTVAHDFNNLLLAVMANIEMAGLQALSLEQRRYLDAAARMVEMGGKLSKRLMGWARQDESTAKDLDLNELVSDIVDVLGRTLVRGYQLRFDASAEPAIIYADPVEIDAAMLNLLMNARDATPEGGRIEVRINVLPISGRSHRYACLSVSDTGSGMTEETRSRAAEPFFTTRQEGTGLGLYSVSETVRKFGGFLEIESEEKKGATVRLFFPLNDHTAE
ncbi:MAG: sensor histidine kinase [Litorimonas sp.]